MREKPVVQDQHNRSILFGIHPVLERLNQSRQEVYEVLLARSSTGAIKLVEGVARSRGVRVELVEGRVLDRLTGGARHQGVVARVSGSAHRDFAGLLSSCTRQTEGHRWILALDGVTDPQNLGSLIRTAEAMGVRDIVIPKDRSAGVTPTVAKASAGATAYVAVYPVTNLRRALADLKEHGYWLVGLDVTSGEEIGARTYPEKMVMVLGSEGSGIRPLVRAECDFLVVIPMSGKIASLNVAVCGGIFLYELTRQKESRSGC